MVQWPRLRAPNAGVPGSIPGQGTRSHVPQLRVLMSQLKPAATLPPPPPKKETSHLPGASLDTVFKQTGKEEKEIN